MLVGRASRHHGGAPPGALRAHEGGGRLASDGIEPGVWTAFEPRGAIAANGRNNTIDSFDQRCRDTATDGVRLCST